MRVRLVCRPLRVQSTSPGTFFSWDWSWNHFYGHSLHTADSSRAKGCALSTCWPLRKYLEVLVNRLGTFPRNSVVKLTDRLGMTIVVDWDVKTRIKIKNRIEKNWATSWENLFLPYANNKGGAHLRSLISAFLVRSLVSIIPVLVKSRIARL